MSQERSKVMIRQAVDRRRQEDPAAYAAHLARQMGLEHLLRPMAEMMAEKRECERMLAQHRRP